MSSRKILLLAASVAFACLHPVLAETLDITAAPLGINSTRVPNASIVTADVATVTGGQYATSDDGTTSFLDITGGTWSTWNPAGVSSVLTLGGIDDASALALGPAAIRLTGNATRLVSCKAAANCGTIRIELANGASWLNTNTLQIAGQQYRKGRATVVLNDATLTSMGGGIDLGKYESDVNCGCCSLYATNSTISTMGSAAMSWAHGNIAMGDYIFSGSTVSFGEGSDYALSVGTGANLLLCDGTDYAGRMRIGGKKPCSLTVDDATAKIVRFNIGTDNATSTAAVHLVKGTLVCADYVCACVSAQPAWMDLQDGDCRPGRSTEARIRMRRTRPEAGLRD